MAGSSASHLKLINAIIGFARNSPTWPHPLHNAGFQPYLIGQKFRPSGSSSSYVCPDVTLRNYDKSHVLLVDAKSGSTIDPDQIRKCQQIRPTDVAQFVTVSNPRSVEIDVAVVCYSDDLIWIVKALDEAEIAAPIIAISNEKISLEAGDFRLDELNEAFSVPIEISSEMAIPSTYVPFDSDTETGDVAEIIMPKVVEYMYRRDPRFNTSTLIYDLFGCYNDLLSDSERKGINQTVVKVLKEAAKNHLREFLKSEKSGSVNAWTIIKNPYDFDPRYQAQSLEALKRRVAKLIADLKGEPWPPEQLKLGWDINGD